MPEDPENKRVGYNPQILDRSRSWEFPVSILWNATAAGHANSGHMLAPLKESERAATGNGRWALRVQHATDGDSLSIGGRGGRRGQFLLFAVLISSLAQESRALPSGRSLQLPLSPQLPAARNAGICRPVCWPAFLVAPSLPRWSGAPAQCSAAGARPPLCWHSLRAPNAARLRSIPVAFARGITPEPRNVPWVLHASAGPALCSPPRSPCTEITLSAVVLGDPVKVRSPASMLSPFQEGGRARWPR